MMMWKAKQILFKSTKLELDFITLLQVVKMFMVAYYFYILLDLMVLCISAKL